jgi:hypothetical protein
MSKEAKSDDEIINWLLQGDISIQYQTKRDLLDEDDQELKQQILYQGWGKQFLNQRKKEGHWGDRFYQPKWISTHYTLLDIRNLNPASHPLIQESIDKVLYDLRSEDGGIQLGPSTAHYSDVCVNGMFLNYASYFHSDAKALEPLIDCLLKEIMPDGGFNCRSTRSGAHHSSMHSTISVLEGLSTFTQQGNNYRLKEIEKAQSSSVEFLLTHHLYKSDKTGKIIHPDFLKFPYPSRWKYDILRALDYLQFASIGWDDRLTDTVNFLKSKRTVEGLWKLGAKHPGQQHFEMEKAGKASRWNTLRAMRSLKHFDRL